MSDDILDDNGVKPVGFAFVSLEFTGKQIHGITKNEIENIGNDGHTHNWKMSLKKAGTLIP